MPPHRPPANIDISMKLMIAPPWIDPPMFIWSSVGNMREMPRPGPSGLNSSRPVAAAKLDRGKSPQLNQPGLSGSGVAPRGTPTSSSPSAWYESSLTQRGAPLGRGPSSGSLGDQLLRFRDRFGRVEPLRADVRAIHDGVAPVEPVWVLQLVEPLAGRFVAAVGDPAISLEQDRWAQELVGVPPIARAARRTAEAKDALVQAVELGPVLRRLQPLARRWRARRLQPRLNPRVLRVRMGEVGDEILDHVHVRQGRDLHVTLEVGDRGGASEPVAAFHIHRARAADAFAAGTAEGQRRIDLVLDLDEGVENHRPTLIEVDRVTVEARISRAVRVVAIDIERLAALAFLGLPLAPALVDFAVLGKREFRQRST